MEQLIDFFINIGKLKRKERKGWTVLHQIKNSESTAEHTFRCAILAWILGREKDLDQEKVIKMALVHDLCEIYGEDKTPYSALLTKDTPREEIEEMRRHRSRTLYSPKERRKRIAEKFKMEAKGLKKLISELPADLKSEVRTLWLDYEKRMSEEGRFVKQVDKMENLLQALQYWREQGQIERDLWIIAAREKVTDPVLIEFLETLDEKFLPKGLEQKEKNEMQNLVDFFIEVGRLKRMPVRGWVLIGVKNPGTIADHLFRVAMMAWVLAKERKIDFNLERILKIALVHDIPEVYAGDETPYDYDAILPEEKEKWPELFDKWPRSSKSEKKEKSKEKHEREKDSLIKLISELDSPTKGELLDLWFDYERGLTKEARFVKQINRLETLLQALEYAKEDKVRPFKSWWVGSKELIDDPLLVRFMNALDRRFHFLVLEKLPRRTLVEAK